MTALALLHYSRANETKQNDELPSRGVSESTVWVAPRALQGPSAVSHRDERLVWAVWPRWSPPRPPHGSCSADAAGRSRALVPAAPRWCQEDSGWKLRLMCPGTGWAVPAPEPTAWPGLVLLPQLRATPGSAPHPGAAQGQLWGRKGHSPAHTGWLQHKSSVSGYLTLGSEPFLSVQWPDWFLLFFFFLKGVIYSYFSFN